MGKSKAQKVAARRKADAAITNEFFKQQPPLAAPVAPPTTQPPAPKVVERFPSAADDSDDSDLESHSEREYPLLPFMTPEVIENLEKIRKSKAEIKANTMVMADKEKSAVDEPGENPHKGKFGVGRDGGWLGELERMMALGVK